MFETEEVKETHQNSGIMPYHYTVTIDDERRNEHFCLVKIRFSVLLWPKLFEYFKQSHEKGRRKLVDFEI